MRVLFIGGTRFIGLNAAKSLIDQGHDITVFHRGQTEADLPNAVQHILGNKKEMAQQRDAFEQFAPDVVIDMILVTEADARRTLDTFRDIAPRIVAISSMDVYRAYGRLIGKEPGDVIPTPLTEESPLRETRYPYRGETPRAEDDPRRDFDDYDKIPIERMLLDEPGISATILRLPMVYGPRDFQHRLYGYIKRIEDKRPAILLNDTTSKWRTTRGYVENVGHAIALAASNERAIGRTYNVADTTALTEAEWVRTIADAMHYTGEIRIVPDEAMPHEGVDMRHHLLASSERIRNELGFSEVVDFADGLRRSIAWERANPPEQIDPSAFDYEQEDKILNDNA